jgi:hypothetical protein
MGNEFLDKFDVVLDASDKDFAEKLTAALGLQPGEQIEFITPQFERVDGRTINYFPKTVREFDALKGLSETYLRNMGCGVWEKTDKEIHFLYPKEWYEFIPENYEIISISGDVEQFKKGETDDDIRYGCLAYGFVQEIH